jgi:hypothetical protein
LRIAQGVAAGYPSSEGGHLDSVRSMLFFFLPVQFSSVQFSSVQFPLPKRRCKRGDRISRLEILEPKPGYRVVQDSSIVCTITPGDGVKMLSGERPVPVPE